MAPKGPQREPDWIQKGLKGVNLDRTEPNMKQGGYKVPPKKGPTAVSLSGVLEAPLDARSGFLGVLDETVPDVCARCSSLGSRWLASGVGM